MTFLEQHQLIYGLGVNVGDFWQWAYSDILSNRNRSIFAEYMVGVALGVVTKPSVEWDSVDLEYQDYKIEVKSSAYWQSWQQEKRSKISFSVRKAVFWNVETGKYQGETTRCAHAYVFCHYAELDKTKVNVLDISPWDFYVISTGELDHEFGEAKSISLKSVRKMARPCKFGELKATVDSVRQEHPCPQAAQGTPGDV